MARRGRGQEDANAGADAGVSEGDQTSGQRKMRSRRILVAGWLAAIALALLASWWTRPSAMAGPGRRMVVIAETPNLSEFSADSAALRYYAGQGVTGVLVRSSTLGSLAAGRDLAMVSGVEILRLFRMEGIVNIYMWEQIRDRPVRTDATYIFSNDLALHENTLAAVQRELGAEAARPYRDGEHDFGGAIPGNYIIEVLAPIESVRGIGVGVEGSVARRFLDAGIEPVVEVATAADVRALPEPIPPLLVSGAGAAEALWEERSPQGIFLARGIRNPGWGQARLAERAIGETFTTNGGAIIASLSEVGPVIDRIKSLGYTVGRGEPEGVGGGAWTIRKISTSLVMAALLAWVLARTLGATATRSLGIATASTSAGFLAAPFLFPGIAAVLLTAAAVIAALGAKQPREGERELEFVLLPALILSGLVLAWQLTPVGRPAFEPWTAILVTLAAVTLVPQVWAQQVWAQQVRAQPVRAQQVRAQVKSSSAPDPAPTSAPGALVATPVLLFVLAIAAARPFSLSPGIAAALLVAAAAAQLLERRETGRGLGPALEALWLMGWPAGLILMTSHELSAGYRLALAALLLPSLAIARLRPRPLAADLRHDEDHASTHS